jgi:hypothetical protein
VSALNDEHNAVMTRAEEAESFLSILKSDLKVEKTSKKQETELLARKVLSTVFSFIHSQFLPLNSLFVVPRNVFLDIFLLNSLLKNPTWLSC